MTKVEIIALAERWQAKADRAMERYQEDGCWNYSWKGTPCKPRTTAKILKKCKEWQS